MIPLGVGEDTLCHMFCNNTEELAAPTKYGSLFQECRFAAAMVSSNIFGVLISSRRLTGAAYKPQEGAMGKQRSPFTLRQVLLLESTS